MKAFTITSKDVYNILQTTTSDKHYIELLTNTIKRSGMVLSEYVYSCFRGYLTGYVKLNDLNLEINEHNKVYDRFVSVAKNMSSRECDSLLEHNNFYGNFSTPRDMSVFDYDVMQVNIIDNLLSAADNCIFGKYRSELYDDMYLMLRDYYIDLQGIHQIPFVENVIREEMEEIVALIKFVIDQLESRILNQRSETSMCYVLFGMHEQNVFVLVH